ncbi:MAG: hypothetical protein WHS87_01060 [Anaerolineales bacterium]
MDYGLIGKIEKAKRYAQEPHRFKFQRFDLTFHGDNNDHQLHFENGQLRCDCEFFITHQRCSHTMALEQVFKDMLNP